LPLSDLKIQIENKGLQYYEIIAKKKWFAVFYGGYGKDLPFGFSALAVDRT
jgi:hypothetical protein